MAKAAAAIEGRRASGTTPAAPPSALGPKLPEAEFLAISATLTATERGRRFLEEYARRRREDAVARLVAAADRIEAQARSTEADRARRREEAERGAEVARQLMNVLDDLRPVADARVRTRVLEARASVGASGLERRFAALVRLEDRDDLKRFG